MSKRDERAKKSKKAGKPPAGNEPWRRSQNVANIHPFGTDAPHHSGWRSGRPPPGARDPKDGGRPRGRSSRPGGARGK